MTRKVTRVDIFFFFASSYRIVGRPTPSLIKFEHMLHVVNPRLVWGFYGSKAWCHIKFAHWVFKHHTHHFHINTWATCTEWVLSSSTPSRGYQRHASPFCGAVWTSITLTNNERERLYDQVGFFLVRVTVHLGEMPSPPYTCVSMCVGGWGGGLLRTTCSLREVEEVRLICEAHVPYKNCELCI